MTAVANPSPTPTRAAIVFNPNKAREDDLHAAATAAEQRHGWADSLWISSKPKSSKPIAQAIAAGVDLVIVSGGDGSVRRAIGDLVDADIPMAVIPTGTGNLLARSLSLPLNQLDSAFDIAFGGSERNLDVLNVAATGASGKLRHDVSVVLSGVGIDAAMIANTNPDLKRRFGWIAYVDGVFRSLPQLVPFGVRVSIDGHPQRTHRAAAVFIANLAEMPGNMSLVPGAEIDDGLLDVIVLQPRNWFDWLFIWRRFSWENAVLRRSELGSQIADSLKGRYRNQVVYKRGRSMELWIDGDAQPFQIDGDTAGSIASLSVTVHPRGMRIRVPQA